MCRQTRLLTAYVPEKMIQEHTGHRSLDSLRLYEQSSDEQQGAVSDILSTTESVRYKNALCSSSLSATKINESTVALTPSHVKPPPPGLPTDNSTKHGGFKFKSCQGCTHCITVQ